MNQRMIINIVQNVMKAEANAILEVCSIIENQDSFLKVVDILYRCTGKVVFSGVGKSGIIARKISSTFSSTGTPSIFLHAAEALHGDLGILTSDDVVVILSNSGESEEINQMIPSIRTIGCMIIAITSNLSSRLAQTSDLSIFLPKFKEAPPLSVAPTVSTTAMLALGDAIAMALMELKKFDKQSFAIVHPAGSIGKKLTVRVKDLMKTGDEIPIVVKDTSLLDAIFEISKKKLGATVVVDDYNNRSIVGIITDGDIRRIVEKNPVIWNLRVENVMTHTPIIVEEDRLAFEALKNMKNNNISVLPVVDGNQKLIGIIHILHIIKTGIL